jgi:uncharacterized protein (DUF1778 family)
MVRLDDESKTCLAQAAKLRGLSLSEYVRTVTLPQARREVLSSREQTVALTPDEQLEFWNALAGVPNLTEPQRQLGALMRGKA